MKTGRWSRSTDLRPEPKTIIAFLLLVFVYAFLLLVLLDRQNAWMQPEAFIIKSHVARTGDRLSLNDLREAFQFWAFEYAPRPNRPLSSLLDIVDTRFRTALWQVTLPHPSASLTHLFSLVLSPILLFLLMRNLGIGRRASLLAVSFYLASPGFLSLVVMLFRSGKPMTNFSIIAALTAASFLDRRRSQGEPCAFWPYLGLVGFVFASTFWDESSLLMYPVLIIFFPGLFLHRRRIAALAGVAVLLVVAFVVILPRLADKPAKLPPDTPENAKDYPPLARVSLAPSPKGLFVNGALLFKESLALSPPWAVPGLWGRLLLSVNALVLGALALKLVRLGLERWRTGSLAPGRPVLALGLALGLSIVWHAYLMQLVDNRLWGPFWYGSYFSIFLALALGFVLDIEGLGALSVLAPTVLVAALLFVFPYTNGAYRHFHYYPWDPIKIRDVFLERINRFRLPEDPRENLETITRTYWQERRPSLSGTDRSAHGTTHGTGPGTTPCTARPATSLPKELLYLPIEMRIPGVSYDSARRLSEERFLPRIPVP